MLQRWHSYPELVADGIRADVMTTVTAQAEEAEQCLDRVADHLVGAQHGLVLQMVHELPRLACGLPIVFRHGDFATRNWLYDRNTDTVALIDFQMAAPGLAVEDLVWLHGALWPTRPDLKDALLAGLRRKLTDVEQRVLVPLTARLTISYLATGITQNYPVLIERGHTVLDHLVNSHR
ncbi:phosphotransferase [Kitasatospora sp. NPDC002040]|uniref:phosphotransferase n=1 Tax=Kitasatospora sp. NPDC002040 TaxID=3154661 RepID=UPI003322ACE3